MDFLNWTPLLVVLIAGGIAAATDVWNFKVYNWLTLPLLVSGFLFHTVMNGWGGLGFSLGGAVFGFIVLIVCYILGGVGTGDVKFLAGVGAWLGILATAQVFLVAGLATGVWSIATMTIQGGLSAFATHVMVMCYQIRSMAVHLGTGERVEYAVRQADRRRRVVPLAAMITVGIFAVTIAQQVYQVSLVSILLGG